MDPADPEFESIAIVCSEDFPQLRQKINKTINNIQAYFIQESTGFYDGPHLQLVDCSEFSESFLYKGDPMLVFLMGRPETANFTRARECILDAYQESTDPFFPVLLSIIPRESGKNIYPPIQRETCLEVDENDYMQKISKVYHDLNSLWSRPRLISVDIGDFIAFFCGRVIQCTCLEGDLFNDLSSVESELSIISTASSVFVIAVFDSSQEISVEKVSKIAEMLNGVCQEDTEFLITDIGTGTKGLTLDYPIRLTILYTL